MRNQTTTQDTKQPREQYWQQLLTEWLASGKQIKTFCYENHISAPSFYQWRNRLKPDFVKRTKGVPQSRKPNNKQFVPVVIEPEQPKYSEAAFILYYPNGCHLRVTKHFDLELLNKINHAMGI